MVPHVCNPFGGFVGAHMGPQPWCPKGSPIGIPGGVLRVGVHGISEGGLMRSHDYGCAHGIQALGDPWTRGDPCALGDPWELGDSWALGAWDQGYLTYF